MANVTVVIPVHNAGKYLAECLASVECQSLRDIEVLCLDDASTDESAAMCQQFAQDDERFKVVSFDESRGAAGARNAGIAMATGDYLMFMDADDWYPTDKVLERLYRAAVEHDALIVGGSFSEYDEKTGKVRTKFKGHQACYSFDSEGFIEYADWQGDIGFHRFMFKRAFLVENDVTYPAFLRYEDPVFLVNAMIAAGRFYAVPDVVYRYRFNHKELALRERALSDAIEAHAELLVTASNNDLPRLREWVIESLTWHLATQTPEAQEAHREAEAVRQSKSYRLGNLVMGPIRALTDALHGR